MAGPEVGRETWESESLATLIGAHVGGNGEHACDAEADLGFLLSREYLMQCRVGECLRVLATPGGVQPNRRLGHQRPSQRMPPRSKVEGALAQVGGRIGIGCAERLCRLQQRCDCYFVTRFGTLRQLGRHLDRQGPPGKEHRGRLSIERSKHRDRHACSHRLERQIVAEHQSALGFDQQVGVNELVNRRQQLRSGQVEHCRHVV